MGHIIFYSLWAVWSVVFMATGWADVWFGALGAGLLLALVTAVPLALMGGAIMASVLMVRDWCASVHDWFA